LKTEDTKQYLRVLCEGQNLSFYAGYDQVHARGQEEFKTAASEAANGLEGVTSGADLYSGKAISTLTVNSRDKKTQLETTIKRLLPKIANLRITED